MAVSFVAVNTPAPTGNTGTSTTPLTPSLPSGTASGDRVYVFQAASNTSAASPANWTALAKDVQIGPTGTAPGSGTGRRYLSVHYRDYDGVWSMPTWDLTSASNNSHAAQALTMRKDPSETWDSPTWSGVGNDATAGTGYSVTTPSFATTTGALVVGLAGFNDNVTVSSGESLTQSGATFNAITSMASSGTATGNDVAFRTIRVNVIVGATATMTHAATLSGSSEGGTGFVQQTATAGTAVVVRSAAGASGAAAGNSAVVTKPNGVVVGDYLLAVSVGDNDGTLANMTGPAGWSTLGSQAAVASQNPGVKVWSIVATSTETAASTFSFAAGAGVFCSAGIIAIQAGTFDATTPVYLGPTFNVQGTSSTTHTAPSLASGVVDGLLVTGHCTDQGGAATNTYTPPSGMTERVDTAASSGFSGLEIATLLLTGTGATGTKDATCNNNRPSASVALIINPAAAAATVAPIVASPARRLGALLQM